MDNSKVSAHWFVVASQKEARIFIKTSDRKKLRLLKTLTNPLGTVKKRNLITENFRIVVVFDQHAC